MSEPIVFISHNRVKDGRLEEFKALAREMIPAIERGKPGTVVFLGYLNEDGTEVHVVHVFANAEGMDEHLGGVDERVTLAGELIETVGYEVYGSPSAQTLEIMRAYAERGGIPLIVRPGRVGGYLHMA